MQTLVSRGSELEPQVRLDVGKQLADLETLEDLEPLLKGRGHSGLNAANDPARDHDRTFKHRMAEDGVGILLYEIPACPSRVASVIPNVGHVG